MVRLAMYGKVVDPSDAWTVYEVLEDRGERVLIRPVSDIRDGREYGLPLPPTYVARKSDIRLLDGVWRGEDSKKEHPEK